MGWMASLWLPGTPRRSRKRLRRSFRTLNFETAWGLMLANWSKLTSLGSIIEGGSASCIVACSSREWGRQHERRRSALGWLREPQDPSHARNAHGTRGSCPRRLRHQRLIWIRGSATATNWTGPVRATHRRDLPEYRR